LPVELVWLKGIFQRLRLREINRHGKFALRGESISIQDISGFWTAEVERK